MYVLRIDIYEKYIKRQLCAFFMLLFSDYADELEVVINSLLIQLFFYLVAPETVKIRVEPAELIRGTEATLICDSSSSNPPAKLSWWRDGIPVEGINNAMKPGLWGGTVSSLELKINVTQEMNGIVYTCQSNNEALQRSVHESVSLQVLCKISFISRYIVIRFLQYKMKIIFFS